MNVLQHLGGSAARLLTVPPLAGARLVGIHLVRALTDRYAFLVSPNQPEDFDFQKGVVFQRGFFGGGHSVSRVELYNNGLRVESSEGAHVADQFIDDLMGWLRDEAGIDLGGEGLRIYNSSVEVGMSVNFSNKFDRLNEIGKIIGRFVEGYGGPSNSFEVTGIVMWTSLQNQGPGQFKFERRVDRNFSDNVFFSSAPLNTSEHLSILSHLEETFA